MTPSPPSDPITLALQSSVPALQSGRAGEAIARMTIALRQSPGLESTLILLATAYKQAGRPADAALVARFGLTCGFRSAALHFELAVVLAETGDLAAARQAYEGALLIDPKFTPALMNLANIKQATGEWETALALLDRAVSSEPANPDLYFNRGNLLGDMRRYDDAAANYLEALRLRPQWLQALCNLANVRLAQKQIVASLQTYAQALTVDPGSVHAKYNFAHVLLTDGRYREGFTLYEYRKQMPDFELAPKGFGGEKLPRLEDMRGKRVLVYWEQGLGDVIQFARFLKGLKPLCARLAFMPQASLHRLMGGLDVDCEILRKAEVVTSDFDWIVPVCSLPLIFGTTLQTIPAYPHYLRGAAPLAPPEPPPPGRLNVGLCWSGSLRSVKEGRTFSINEFLGVAEAPGVEFVSLQKVESHCEMPSADLARRLVGLDPEFERGPDLLLETARRIEALDVVVTCDTAIAHLAGAMGKPVWVALKYVCDWRWALDGDTSLWYPTARLFRQSRDGDWKGVFRRIDEALGEAGRAKIAAESPSRVAAS